VSRRPTSTSTSCRWSPASAELALAAYRHHALDHARRALVGQDANARPLAAAISLLAAAGTASCSATHDERVRRRHTHRPIRLHEKNCELPADRFDFEATQSKAYPNRNRKCRSKRSGTTSTRPICFRSSNRSFRGRLRAMPTSTSIQGIHRVGRRDLRAELHPFLRDRGMPKQQRAFGVVLRRGFSVAFSMYRRVCARRSHVRHQHAGDPRLPPYHREEPACGPSHRYVSTI